MPPVYAMLPLQILDCWADLPADGAVEGQEVQTEAVFEALLSRSLNHPHIV